MKDKKEPNPYKHTLLLPKFPPMAPYPDKYMEEKLLKKWKDPNYYVLVTEEPTE